MENNINKISNEEMTEIIEKWSEDARSAPLGKFYCKEDDIWVACDNNDSCCWTEDFKTEQEAINYLNGIEL